MARTSSLVCLCLLLAILQAQALTPLKWWQTASFYQIYPRSWKDSDGDGVGDLKGVTEQLTYLREIGITATWLSPIFTSPMADFGYDIANFTEIDPTFGTMADFEALLVKAKEIGLKIILDFVPNHSSDECEWFIKSAAKDRKYSDYYVWHPGKLLANGTRTTPTNWISVFRGSTWTWHAGRGEYYLHQFHHKQPDFNYRNPEVKEMMKDVLRFWLRKGVAGFRVDAVPHVFEVEADDNGDWPDEPRNSAVRDPEDYDYLDHVYTVNQPETVQLIYEFRSVIDEIQAELGSDDLILMTEAYAPIEVIMQYYGNETVEGAQIPFNFELINSLTSTSNAYYYEELIHNWLNLMPEGRTANWVLGNHDRSRVGTRMGAERIDAMNMLLFTLPGCSVTYQGEEIGMTDVWISWDDTIDPAACQSNPQEYERLSRDPVRTPFQWNDQPQAGFTDGATTWLPVASDYKTVNVKRERGISHSHLNIFKQLKGLRGERAFREGTTQVKALNANVLLIKRALPGGDTFVVLLNINNHYETINLRTEITDAPEQFVYELVTNKSFRRPGDVVNSNAITLLPMESVILRGIL